MHRCVPLSPREGNYCNHPLNGGQSAIMRFKNWRSRRAVLFSEDFRCTERTGEQISQLTLF